MRLNGMTPSSGDPAGSMSTQLTPISSKSSFKVLRCVFFGLPIFLLPSSGTQYFTVLAGLSVCSRRTRPVIVLLLVLTMSSSRSVPLELKFIAFILMQDTTDPVVGSRHEGDWARQTVEPARGWDPPTSTQDRHQGVSGARRQQTATHAGRDRQYFWYAPSVINKPYSLRGHVKQKARLGLQTCTLDSS